MMAPAGAPARRSRFAGAVYDYSLFTPLVSLTAAIEAASPDLVIPCDDRALGLLLRRHAAGGPGTDLIARSLGAPAAYGRLTARADFIAAAAEEGICVPETVNLDSEADLERGLARIGFPAVLKSDGSWGGEGVAIVHSCEEAYAAFDRLSRSLPPLRALARALRRRDAHHFTDTLAAVTPRLSMQAYIPGMPATTAFACWQGEVLAAIHADVVTAAGSTGPASVVRIVADEAMQAAAVKLSRRFGLSGLHGLDFIRDGEGRVHLLEINPRATQTAALPLGAGRDLVAALTARVAPQSAVAVPPTIDGDLVALFPQEWRRDPASSFLTEAHHDVPWDDPVFLRACLTPGCPHPVAGWLARFRPVAASLPLGNQAVLASEP